MSARTDQAGEITPEDEKLITLARGARDRVASREGAAVRDGTGRSYSGSEVDLASLQISAVQLAVAQAVAAGAESLEAVVLVTTALEPSPGDLGTVADVGGRGVPLLLCSPRGEVKNRLSS